MQDWLRNLFSIRQKRRNPPVKGLPKAGSAVMCGNVKMHITQPVPPELWEWMVLSGWRNLPVTKDRRTCVELPLHALEQLIKASPAERSHLHARLLRGAQQTAT